MCCRRVTPTTTGNDTFVLKTTLFITALKFRHISKRLSPLGFTGKWLFAFLCALAGTSWVPEFALGWKKRVCKCCTSVPHRVGWSGGAMVLGKLLVLGRPTNLDYSRARAFCACRRCGWGLFGHFFSHLSCLSSFSLSLGDGPI